MNRQRRPKPPKRFVIGGPSKPRRHERPATCMICLVARRLQAAAPAVVWSAEFYLEVHWTTQAIIEYLEYFAEERRQLPVSLYFDVVDLIDARTGDDRWLRGVQDALGQLPRPRIGDLR